MTPGKAIERTTVPFLDLQKQHAGIKDEIEGAIRAVIDESAFVGGRFVAEFEEAFSAYLGAEACVGVANGTDALEVGLEALELRPGAEVIVPANSFIATSEAVSRMGLTVVFADVDEATFALDPVDVRRRITDSTGAIIAVHLYGHPAPMTELRAIAHEHGLALIEDAAQAHGAEYGGARVGNLGALGTFSFYPGKNLGAMGDAGALVTEDADLAARARMIANHGRVAKYEHLVEARNSRLDGLQAAILSVKLRRLDGWIAHRRGVAGRYGEGLCDIPELTLPSEAPDVRHVYHLYVIRSAVRDRLRGFLGENGIQTGIHYPIALPRQPAYQDHPQVDEDLTAVRLSSEILSLPIGESMTSLQADRVVEVVRRFFGA